MYASFFVKEKNNQKNTHTHTQHRWEEKNGIQSIQSKYDRRLEIKLYVCILFEFGCSLGIRTQITKKNINSFTTKHHKFMYAIVFYSSGEIGFSADGTAAAAVTFLLVHKLCVYRVGIISTNLAVMAASL